MLDNSRIYLILKNLQDGIDKNKNSYPLPKIYDVLHSKGIEYDHMYNTFNMGIGFIICVDKNDVSKTLAEIKAIGDEAYEIGYIKEGNEKICLK